MAQTQAKQSDSATRQPPPAIVWFRNDLRLSDNPALWQAVSRRAPVLPVFIWAPEEEAGWPLGGASKWWLNQSLAALQGELFKRGSRLIVRHGCSRRELQQIAAETAAAAVYWNRRLEPAARARDERVEKALRASGLEVRTFNAALLHEPSEIRNTSGKPFQVFTAFWKHCLALPEPADPLCRPGFIPAPKLWPHSVCLDELALKPVPDWAGGLGQAWTPGEAGAAKGLDCFLAEGFGSYETNRNRPDLAGTSRLSPHLHLGEISARQIWQAVKRMLTASQRAPQRARPLAPATWRDCQFLSELGWREFAHYLLYHFPHTASEPLRSKFARLKWRNKPDLMSAWQRGLTGYPLVDAGMRELWATGWMHNRVRMVVASFLVKDLLISWQEGARWFWDTLVDADLAQNTFNWQWCAGCGADAAPFFRIFNPVSQGEKFDPVGGYIRRWVPELAPLPDQWIHKPHLAPTQILIRSGIRLGTTYPQPIINHLIAREVALEAYRRANKR